MKKILPLIIIAFYATSIFAQFHQGKIKQKHYFQVIPYQEIKGLLIVPVTINGKTYQFAFDTGASLAISDKLYKELNLRTICQIKAGDASGEKDKARIISLPEIDLQGITFRNTFGVVFHENPEQSNFLDCLGVDGLIGSNMVRNSIVQFDVLNKQIIITNDIKKVSLGNSECQKMELSLWQSSPYIQITLQKEAHITVEFDSGYGGGFFTSSLNKLNGCVVDTIAESEGTPSVFGFHGAYKKQKHVLLNIPKLDICGTTFNDVIVTATQNHHSLLGTKFLQYGKVTLDYKKKNFYFEVFDNINTNQPTENQWAISTTIQNNKLIVGIIWDKTLESQINLEDEILSINGMDIQSMSFCELFLLKFPESDKCILELRDINTGAIKTVEIERMHP